MKRTKKDLDIKVEELCLRVINSRVQKQIVQELFTEHGIPASITSDILTLRRDPSTETIFVLYHIMNKIDRKLIADYFTEKECKEFNKEVFDTNDVKFPLRFKAIQISDDQWVSKISVKELMAFSKAQMINYNENAQRVLKRIIKGGEEAYRIQLNKNAVAAIEESLMLGHYIPNMITLNIPQEDDNVFGYDENKMELVIKKLKMFDILDGYHRYVAICHAFIQDSSFDSQFELRITNFSDERARQFIWQEDQKTQMSRIDSNALNKYDNGNLVVSKLKDSNYGNIIGRNNIINDAELSQIISAVFTGRKKHTNSEINNIATTIKRGFVAMEEGNPNIFDAPINTKQLYCMLICFSCNIFDYELVEKYTKEILDNKLLPSYKVITEAKAKKIKKFIEGRG